MLPSEVSSAIQRSTKLSQLEVVGTAGGFLQNRQPALYCDIEPVCEPLQRTPSIAAAHRYSIPQLSAMLLYPDNLQFSRGNLAEAGQERRSKEFVNVPAMHTQGPGDSK